MTNQQIIFTESLKLMEQGILKGCGKFAKSIQADGTEKEIELPESIHTYAAWQQLGYQVKRGEKSKATIMIWKHKNYTKKSNDDENGEVEESRMFLTKAYFFTIDQVEKKAEATA